MSTYRWYLECQYGAGSCVAPSFRVHWSECADWNAIVEFRPRGASVGSQAREGGAQMRSGCA
jgi:hypothetical protein